MVTTAAINDHRQAIDDLATLAQADLVGAWRGLDLADADTVRATALELVPALVDTYGAAAATLGADWYDDLRADAVADGLATGDFAAVPAEAVEVERSQALARWGVGPLFVPAAEPSVAGTAALSLIAGGLQREIANADRRTIERSVQADPSPARWERRARPGCCAFCGLLSTRGAVYASAESALSVAGRGAEDRGPGGRGRRGQGVRVRGSQGIGARYHDNCRCLAVAAWGEGSVPRDPYENRYFEAYTNATSRLAPGEPVVLKDVLASMRAELGVA